MNPDAHDGRSGLTALASLRRLLRPRAVRERCALCSLELADEHDHLLELSSRRLACACEPCAILFSGQGAAKYRRVPRRAECLPDFRLTDLAWAGLDLPINLAFFVHSTPAGRVLALYPSPGGAVEAPVPPEAWQMLAEDNPVLREFEPDVEALLVNRVGEARECYRVGIDRCYQLVGLIRTHWQGFSGGAAVWEEVGRFFAGLREGPAHA
jgi:Family of unknown function (DUF5947)